MNRTTTAPAIAAAMMLPGAAAAQEAMYTAAATMPSPGVTVVREQFQIFQFGRDPKTGSDRTQQYEAETTISCGLDRGLALSLDIPFIVRKTELPDAGDHWDKGVSDLDLTFKYRFYKDDTGGIDTTRIALMGGAAFASGDDHDFSSQSVNPHLGIVFTKVWGRHGFNQEFSYRFNTGNNDGPNFGGEGPSDAFRYNSAYLFRIAPAEYTEESTGAWYITAEINGLYETNGDNDIRFAPGLMYEGHDFALELMAQVPLYENVHNRAEFDFAVGIGLRFTFNRSAFSLTHAEAVLWFPQMFPRTRKHLMCTCRPTPHMGGGEPAQGSAG